MRILPTIAALTSVALLPSIAFAQVSLETQYILNTFLFLFGGVLVMIMAAGFCCLEAGMVRSTSVSTICVKNISLYGIAGTMYFLVGYHLMYTGVDGGYMGKAALWLVDDSANLALDGSFVATEPGYAAASDWFFQMVFVATAASIVSGTIAERVKLWSFLFFAIILTGFIYPIAGSWHWGAGWLQKAGFADFAGSTVVHSVGGWAALVAVLMIGPRKGRYTSSGQPIGMPGSSLPLATLGTFILWFGWFGFNGASQLAMGSAVDVTAVATIFANTNIAACGGLVVALFSTQILYRKVDPSLVLNGALAGLVSITAEPLTPSTAEAFIIGGVGGFLMILTVPMLDKRKIDDVVGAIPVHLVCGIWGTMAVPITNKSADFYVQFMGVLSYGGFTIIASFVAWKMIQGLMGLRISDEDEHTGIDRAEVGLDAYPEFVRASSRT